MFQSVEEQVTKALHNVNTMVTPSITTSNSTNSKQGIDVSLRSHNNHVIAIYLMAQLMIYFMLQYAKFVLPTGYKPIFFVQ